MNKKISSQVLHDAYKQHLYEKEQLLKQHFIQCGDLIFNNTTYEISYKNGSPVSIGKGSAVHKLFLLLEVQRNKTVTYESIIQTIYSNFSKADQELKSNRDVQYALRNLKARLKKAGMPKNEIKKLIELKKNVGYKLVC